MRIFITILALTFTCATPAFAQGVEITVYNGIDPVAFALKTVALWYSDPSLKVLAMTVAVLGLFGGMWASISAGIASGRPSADPLLTVIVPGLLALIVYVSIASHTGTVVVNDPVKNRFETIPGVPSIIGFALNFTNTVERTAVELIEKSGDPNSTGAAAYTTGAGGIGFDLLYGITTKGVTVENASLKGNAAFFVYECVAFEMMRGGGKISMQHITQGDTPLLKVFEEAQNDLIFTDWYNHDGGKENINCTSAYSRLKEDMEQSFSQNLSSTCALSGFDPTIASEVNACKKIIDNTLTWVGSGASGSAGIWRTDLLTQQTLLTRALTDGLTMGDAGMDASVKTEASRQTGYAAIASGIAGNSVLPIIRAAVLGLVIAVTPLLFIFLPTPRFGQVLMGVVGLYVWIAFWGVLDAVLHGFAMHSAHVAFEEVRNLGLGSAAITAFPTASLKTLAAFSMMRWSAAGVAAAAAAAIGFKGGHALSMVAAPLTSTQEAAAQRAGALASPEGRAQMLTSQEMAGATLGNHPEFGAGVYMDRIMAEQRRGLMEFKRGRDYFGSTEALTNAQASTSMGALAGAHAELVAGGGMEGAAFRGATRGAESLADTTAKGGPEGAAALATKRVLAEAGYLNRLSNAEIDALAALRAAGDHGTLKEITPQQREAAAKLKALDEATYAQVVSPAAQKLITETSAGESAGRAEALGGVQGAREFGSKRTAMDAARVDSDYYQAMMFGFRGWADNEVSKGLTAPRMAEIIHDGGAGKLLDWVREGQSSGQVQSRKEIVANALAGYYHQGLSSSGHETSTRAATASLGATLFSTGVVTEGSLGSNLNTSVDLVRGASMRMLNETLGKGDSGREEFARRARETAEKINEFTNRKADSFGAGPILEKFK